MHLSINMAVSMDGKIATAKRGAVKLGSSYDSRRMAEIRAEHDVVINGASTFRAHPYPLHVNNKKLQKERKKRGQSEEPISAIVSSKLELPKRTEWEKSPKERWVFCGKKATVARVKYFQKAGVRVVQCSGERPLAMEILSAFSLAGCKSVLLEGGGEFNATFLENDLVDTIYLTIVPILIGGKDSPTFFEGKGCFPFARFRLSSYRKVQDELYLVYKRKRSIKKKG